MPLCLKIPRTAPIYQCSQGHIHCEACHPRLEECPVCRSSITGDIRNLIMEKILERLPTKCVYFENGCQQPADLPQVMIKHEQHCDFRMVTCIDEDCAEKFILSDIKIHLREKHDSDPPLRYLDLDIENRSNDSIIPMETDFDESELNMSEFTDGDWPMEYTCYNDRQFLIRRYARKGYFQITVHVLSDDVDNYSCRLYAKGETMKTSIDVRGQINLIDCKKSEVIPILTLSCNQVKQMVNQDAEINFFLQIMAKEDDKFDFEVTDGKSSDFLVACRDGNIEWVAKLLLEKRRFAKQSKQINFNARDLTGMTGFMHACHNGHANVVTHLLRDKRLDVNLVDDGGTSGLNHACMKGHADIVEVLLYSPHIKPNGEDRTTPFMNACFFGQINVAKKIIEFVENHQWNLRISTLWAYSEHGDTAFHYACRSKCEELVDWMIASKEKMERFGILFDEKNDEGETGYDLWPEKFKDNSSSSNGSPRKRQRISELSEPPTYLANFNPTS